MFAFCQMGKTSERTKRLRKLSALGGAANARRRLIMRTAQAHLAGTSPPFDLGSTDFGDPHEAMATCSDETMRTSELLLEGDCLDGILALLKAKALCRVMSTCRALKIRVATCSAWSALGPRTGTAKLRAWQMTKEMAVGVAPRSLPQLSSRVRLAGRAEKLSLHSVQSVHPTTATAQDGDEGGKGRGDNAGPAFLPVGNDKCRQGSEGPRALRGPSVS